MRRSVPSDLVVALLLAVGVACANPQEPRSRLELTATLSDSVLTRGGFVRVTRYAVNVGARELWVDLSPAALGVFVRDGRGRDACQFTGAVILPLIMRRLLPGEGVTDARGLPYDFLANCPPGEYTVYTVMTWYDGDDDGLPPGRIERRVGRLVVR